MSSKLSDILKLFAWEKPGGAGHSSGPKAAAQGKAAAGLKPKVIKLNFRDICAIDPVDSSYHEIQELSLNHNHLRSLDGVEQFRNLRSLHLNFNQLRSRDELRKLANPGLLQELGFKGNPNLEFASKEEATEWALDAFPSLQHLNG